ncbi:archaellar assembly protein FlaJ [Methanoregula sp.]|uniref:archaellar assembly protein FlaJ n=1 Tax=Methanoregula sp. TaxID=2052170 RepID=UPI00236C2E89|nr:archaellar assembly protein FlaJ [Methanoregula sp.]MDD1687061.1 archaellar assembly protein FlaJ [Methanoregula sp.]
MPDPTPDTGEAKRGRAIPFASTIEGLKAKLNDMSEGKKMSGDLLFMTTYMASLALANASRPEIFSFSANRKEYISARYIAKVDTYTKKWGWSYSESLSIVAERVKNPILQSMLNRYANAIESGVPDDDFLKNELATVRSVYRSQVEQGLEMVQKWGDAYIAMLLSGTVIGVTLMISIAIYSPTGLNSTLNMAYGIILAISFFGNLLMYQSSPDDPKTHGLSSRPSKEQKTIYAMERIIIPITIAGVIILALLGASAGMIYLLIGILLVPLGLIGFIDDANITMRDNDFSVFIRSFGAVMGGQGTTAVYALNIIDRKSLIALEPLVDSVYSKMNLGLDTKQVWDKFIGESGSNYIYKYLNIYLDTVTLGGPPEPIGNLVGASVLEQTLLREKKDMRSRSFIILLFAMHIAMTAIFVALYRIMVVLTGSVTSMMSQFQNVSSASGASSMGGVSANQVLGGGLGMFTNFPEKEMGAFVVICLTIITISDILAARIVGGGDRYMFYFYGAIFCLLTGLVLVLTPIGVGMFFSPEGLQQMGAGVAT